MFGRERELEELHTVVIGRGQGAIISGGQGVGKTTLWEAFVERIQDHFLVTRIRASKGISQISFGAFVGLLPDISRRRPSELQVLRRGFEAFRGRSGELRPALCIDDIQFLDNASAALVYELVSFGNTTLLATRGSTERLPESIKSLVKQQRAQQIELRAV